MNTWPMARQLEQWTETTGLLPDEAVMTVRLEEFSPPFPLDWYKANPRLAMDRLAKFECNPEFTPYYDEGDI